ncbi:MAG: CpaF family protein [Armatimonadetes bacterium]|nr:CpaF family protein [Armatimonadota bacterium]
MLVETGRDTRQLMDELCQRIHRRLLTETEFPVLQRLDAEQLRGRVQQITDSELQDRGIALTARAREQLVEEVMNEVVGYGPIQPLIDDPTISEIMVNGPHQVFVEINGRLQLTDRKFVDDEHVMRVIDRIVSPLGRRVDESMPMVDARLPDGSRVNVIIPPLALNGPCITIRKFSRTPLTPEKLVELGTMSEEMCIFLEAAVHARLNIIVSGGTGSGKTTTLNALSSFIPAHERIITIEDAAELQLQQDHVVTLESRPPNIEGKGEITIRQLVRNALRMRPDRIVVGEVRGAEALDMLQAMNTGHDGSMSTLHSNSPRDTLSRLETMVLMAGTDLPSRAIREQIASALHLIVHQSRLRDGSRKITHITEVQRMEGEQIVLQDLFVFDQRGVDRNGKVVGEHVATGCTPLFMDLFEAEGVELPPDIFMPSRQRRVFR